MTAIKHSVEQLIKFDQDQNQNQNQKISKKDYDQWARGFVFDGLRNQRYGQSFCNYFDITDNILFYAQTVDEADRYIQKTYIV
jgi:hypothetical protein